MHIASLLPTGSTQSFYRVTSEGMDTKDQQQDAAEELQIEYIVADIVEHKAHAIACDQGIEQVAQGCSTTSYKAIPTAFVQRALQA